MVNDTFHYRYQNDQVISGTFLVDSVRVNGNDTTFYFNRPGCEDCFAWQAGPAPCSTCYGLKNLPAVVGGYSLEKRAGGVCMIYSLDTVELRTLAHTGDTCLFIPAQNISAVVLAEYTGVILSQPDSLKLAALSNGDTVIWSAAHGIVKWPAGFGSGNYYHLSGIQNRSLGDTMLTLLDYYDFQPGDVFQYAAHEFNPGNTTYNTYHKKYIVLQRQDYADSIAYTFSLRVRWSYTNPTNTSIFGSGSNYYPSVNMTIYNCPSHPINQPNHTMIYPTLTATPGRTSRLIGCNDTMMSYSPCELIYVTDSLGNQGAEYGRTTFQNPWTPEYWLELQAGSDTLVGGYGALWPWPAMNFFPHHARYIKGLGLTEFGLDAVFEASWNEWLEGYYKTGFDTVGIINDDLYFSLGVNEIVGNVNLFPNPANESLRIELAQTNGTARIELLNLQGGVVEQITTTNTTHTLSTAVIPAGMYLLRVSNDQGVRVQRVVIAH